MKRIPLLLSLFAACLAQMAPAAALPVWGDEGMAAIVPPVPAVPDAAAAVIPGTAPLLPGSSKKTAEEAAAAAVSGLPEPAAQTLSSRPTPQALTSETVWWENHEATAGQTRRSAAPASVPAQTGSDPDPDAFARVLADRLRDAAGNM